MPPVRRPPVRLTLTDQRSERRSGNR